MKLIILFPLFLTASFVAFAEPFPSDNMTGTWRMTKNIVTEVDPGNGTTPTESEARYSIMIEFLGGNRLKATESHVHLDKESTATYDYTYSDGEICFTKINGRDNPYLKDKLFGQTRASRFALIKRDDNTFEMKYADLATLSRDWAVVGSGSVEYASDGSLRAITRIGAGGMNIKMTERHPPMIFKRVAGGAAHSAKATSAPSCEILALGRKAGNDFTYFFKLKAKDGSAFTEFPEGIKNELKAYMVDDYAESFSDTDVSALSVNFSDISFSEGTISGSAAVLTLDVKAFDYSPATRIGGISVQFGDGQREAAREYVNRNIAIIVRDKNIALVTGEVPSEATIHIEREEVVGDDILKVVFRAVD
jgi:hypothetical protein